jgi:hypothetical protein
MHIVMTLLAAALSSAPSIGAELIPADVHALVSRIYQHAPAPQVALYVTGGGMQLVPWLLAVPGASSSVLEVRVPYARPSLDELLGEPAGRACTRDVARRLASAAYSRACALSAAAGVPTAPRGCVGLGCTAALRSGVLKRGDHRCFVAVHSAAGVHELALKLAKGERSRPLEDAVVSRCALLGLARACGIEPLDPVLELTAADALESAFEAAGGS